jgi:hypothetical protein
MSGRVNQLFEPLQIQQPDPQQPSPADAWTANTRMLTDWLNQQQQISADRGFWQGGQPWQGGGPTGAGLVNAAQQTGNALLMGTTAPGVRAFHGSPYSFDAFDASKIGTGEGAQAYGHGLYFAENEGVARGYRDALVQKYTQQRPVTVQTGGPFGDVGMLEDVPRDPGHMYEVNIGADPQHFLDWDIPLTEQSQDVQDKLAKTDWYPFAQDQLERKSLDNPIGRDLHHWLMEDYDPHEGATLLRDAGIPGIKYLDAGSRGAGQGSSNFVVFDPATIDILRKYGLAGLGIGLGAAATQGGQQQ